MKRLTIFGMLCISMACHAQQTLLPNYNHSYYPNVLQAAQGVGQPFLLQQNVLKMPGVTVQKDSFLVYNNVTYAIHEKYLNPTANYSNGYYVSAADYPAFGISSAQAKTWPIRIPYALYNAKTKTFNSTIDCVGYGTRLLSATGNAQSNAYVQLMAYMHQQNVSPFAYNGYVASAYEIATAFPTLPASVSKGWQYVAGNVESHVVDSINQHNKSHKGLKPYTGQSKGGFAHAKAGDILGFGYAPGSKSNGHFMVMEQTPILLNSKTLAAYFSSPQTFSNQLASWLNKYNVYAVPLLDCSGPHIHFNDSRKYMSGIGQGTILVVTDKKYDIPYGFVFEPPKLKTTIIGLETMSSRTIAITVGRYNP